MNWAATDFLKTSEPIKRKRSPITAADLKRLFERNLKKSEGWYRRNLYAGNMVYLKENMRDEVINFWTNPIQIDNYSKLSFMKQSSVKHAIIQDFLHRSCD